LNRGMNNAEVCERLINYVYVLVVIRTTLHCLNQIFRGRLLAGIAGSKLTRAWMSASCDFFVLSGRCLSGGLITCPDEPYGL
jgi:uncharacterized membrane protein